MKKKVHSTQKKEGDRLRSLRWGVALCCLASVATSSAFAQSWKRIGTVTTLTNNQLCRTDGTNIICDVNTPTLSGTNVAIGTTAVTTGVALDLGSNVTSLLLPNGTTGQRPSGVNGMVRYNSSTPGLEAYVNGSWMSLLSSGGASTLTLGTSTATTNPSRGGDITTGFYTAGAGLVDLAASGTQVEEWSTGGVNITTGGLNIAGQNGISFPQDYTTNASIAIGSSALSGQPLGTAVPGIQGNIAIGYQSAGGGAITGAAYANSAIGYQTLKALTSGYANTAIGSSALTAVTSGNRNDAIGYQTMKSLTTGAANEAMGQGALNVLTIGGSNIAIGYGTGFWTSGSSNSYVGYEAGFSQTSGSNNVAIGQQALYSPTFKSAFSNSTAVGFQSFYSIGTAGNNNTGLGYNSGYDNTTGADNVIIGAYPTTGVGVTTGTSNIMLGYDVRPLSQTGSNQLNIGNLIYATGIGTGAINSTGYIGISSKSPTVTLDMSQRTDAVALPAGTTGQEPSGVNGMIRYNSTTPAIEAYVNNVWSSLLTSATAGVTSFGAGTTGFTPNTATTGVVTLAGTLNVANGGTGDATLTAHGLLVGEGTSAANITAAGATGTVLIGSSGADPVFSASPTLTGLTLSGLSAVGVVTTNGAGVLTTNTYLPAADFPALTGDVTTVAGALATTVAKIQGTIVSGTTGTTNVVFSGSPTLTGTVSSANITVSGTATLTLGTDYTATGPQADVALGSVSAVRYNGASTATFYGLVAGTNGQVLYLHNASLSTLTLSNQNLGSESTAANRIITGTGNDLPVPSNTSVTLQYDGASSRWRVTGSSNAASALAAGTAGQVQFNGSPNLAANSNLTWDNTNYRLGIGSSIPTVALDMSLETDAISLPAGTTGQRPSGVNGMVRYNNSLAGLESYVNGAWTSLLTTSGSSSLTLGTSLTALNPAKSGDSTTGFYSDAAGAVEMASAGTKTFSSSSTYTLIPVGNVGIGSTAPTKTLDVIGTGRISTSLVTPLIYPATDSTSAIQFDAANGTTNVMTIDTTNSRVGIGTTTANNTLEIGGGLLGTLTGTKVTVSNATANSGVEVGQGSSARGRILWFYNATAANAYMTLGVSGGTNPLDLQDGGGNVGIGSTVPRASLDLSQKTDAVSLPSGTTGQEPIGVNGMIRYNSATPAVEAYVSNVWTSLLTTGSLGSISLGTSAATTNPTKSGDITTGLYSDAAGTVEISSAGAKTFSTNSVYTFVPTGNVGIGSSLPAKTLDVVGTGRISTSLVTPLIYPATDATSAIQFDKANGTSNVMAIDTTNSRVGIGSTVPRASLDVSQNTDALALPAGTTGQEPTGVNGMIRYNSTTLAVEAYVNNTWASLLSGSSGVTSFSAGTTGFTPNTATTGVVTLAGTLNVANGGTGDTTLTAHGLLVGEGTSAANITAAGAAGTVLIGSTGADPIFSASPSLTNITLSGRANLTLGTDYTTTGLQQDVALGTASAVRYNGAGTATFYGLVAGNNGQILYLHNASSSTLTLSNQSVGSESTPANRIITGTGLDLPVPSNTSVMLQYDGTASRWRVTGSSNSANTLAAGTIGQVQFNSGTNLAADSNFYWDNTNKRLGIGSSIPTVALDLSLKTDAVSLPSGTTGQEPTGVNGMIRYNSTTPAVEAYVNNSWKSLATSGSTVVSLGTSSAVTNPSRSSDLTTGLYSDAAGTVEISSAGTKTFSNNSSLTVIPVGSVGIGTTTPGSSLQVNGNAAIGYSPSTTAPTNGAIIQGNVGIGTATVADTLDVYGAGNVNGVKIAGATTGASPTIAAVGADANVGLNLAAKGTTGNIALSAGGALQASVIGLIGAVNYFNMGGSTTGGNPYLTATGADTNVGLTVATKGSGGISLNPGGSGSTFSILATTYTAPVNYLAVQGNGPGFNPTIYAFGSDANVGINIVPQGSGSFVITSGNMTVNSGAVAVGSTVVTPGVALDLGNNKTASNSSLLLPLGTTGTRPTTGLNGMMRYNSTTPAIEGYVNGAWTALLTTSGSSSLTLGTSLTALNPAKSGDSTTGLYSDAAGTVEIASAGTKTFSSNSTYTLIPTGSVGIGSASPLKTFDVVGTGRISTSLVTPLIYPATDSTAAIQFDKANGSSNVMTIDTTNSRVGIGSATPRATLDLSQNTDAVALPAGTTGQRPTGANGMVRYNSTTPAMEAYVNNTWSPLATGSLTAITLGTTLSANNPQRSGEANTGLYTAASGKVDVAELGTQVAEFNSTGLNIVTGAVNIAGSNGISFPTTDTASGGGSIAIGASALAGLPASAYYIDTAVGYQAMGGGGLTTAASNNTAIGGFALKGNTSGDDNTAVGENALLSNTTAIGNTAFGSNAMKGASAPANQNTVIGYYAMYNSGGVFGNVAIGANALQSLTASTPSVAVGYIAGQYLTSGFGNTFLGSYSGAGVSAGSPVTGSNNVAVGDSTLKVITSAAQNTVLGTNTGKVLTTGSSNTLVGYNVGSSTLTTGSNNILIGSSASTDAPASGTNNFLNINNVIVADMTNASATAASDKAIVAINIGNAVPTTNPLTIGNGSNSNGNGAYLSTAGVWTNASDGRIKENVRDIPYGLDAVMKLKPVAYDMKNSHEAQVGFIAQDVLKIVPEVVGVPQHPETQNYGLSYGNMVAVVVKAMQELKSLFDADHAEIAALKAANDNQAKQIEELRAVMLKQQQELDTRKAK